MVEGDGIAQHVQSIEGNNSMRVFDSERRKKRGCALQSLSTAVMKSAGGRRRNDGGLVKNESPKR